jgi:hypothetical protein
MPTREIGLRFQISQTAAANRIKRWFPQVWGAYYSKENAKLKFEPKNTGGLRTMENTIMDDFDNWAEGMLARIEAAEALGSERGPEFRNRLQQMRAEYESRLEAIGMKADF